MNAVIYARYSSDMQREESIDAQVRACTDYASSKGLTVVGQYLDEAVSGKGSKTSVRREYQRMLQDCKKDLFSIILVHKYDRVARSLAEHVALEKRLQEKSIDLIAVSQDFGNSKEAKIMRALMWSLSEYYSENLAEEVRKGHKETALQGKHNGGFAPFGYDVQNQEYAINEFEAHFVRRMFQTAANREGFQSLVDEMEQAGIRGRMGRPIRYSQIYDILRNEKYTGVYVYSSVEEKKREGRRARPEAIRVEGALPAIIEKRLFQEVQTIMTERKHAGRHANYLCSGLVYCSCGAKMHGQKSSRKGHDYFYYICSKKCGAPVARMEDVDAAALSYLRSLSSPKNQKLIAKELRSYDSQTGDAAKAFREAIDAKIKEKQKQYDAMISNMTSAALPPEVLTDMGVKMQEIRAAITGLEQTEPPKDVTTEIASTWLEAIKKAPDEKAVHLLIERIDVTENHNGFSVLSTLESVVGNIGGDRGARTHDLTDVNRAL